jgi:hypothetical protein
MTRCANIIESLADLAARTPADMPGWAASHLAECSACTRRLQAERLTGALLRSLADPIAPPPDFAARVAARLRPSAARRTETDLWRPAWKLMPAFGALVVALFVVYQSTVFSEPIGFLPTDSLTAGEHLALGSATPETDDVLSVILEGSGR